MKKIEKTNLKGEYLMMKSKIDEAIKNVFDKFSFINGSEVSVFAKNLSNYLDIAHVIPCANGTDALQIALMSLDLKHGDEVITVDFTFGSTVEVIKLLGLTPVLVDVEKDSFNMSIPSLKKAITDKTKVIIPVHLFGQCADMALILDLAKKHNAFVIEDTAQALGCDYIFENNSIKKSGTIGTIGTTSFFPSKNLGCYGDGGAIFTNDTILANRIKMIANHGMSEKYHYDRVGVNSRLDTIQAAILNVKIPFLDENNDARRKIANIYNSAFDSNSDIVRPSISAHSKHVYHQYTIRVLNKKRDQLKNYLDKNGIPNSVYYPVSLHSQLPYSRDIYREEDFKNTNELVMEVISLPIHSGLDERDLMSITSTVIDFFKN